VEVDRFTIGSRSYASRGSGPRIAHHLWNSTAQTTMEPDCTDPWAAPRTGLMGAGDNPAGHLCLLVQVVAGTDPVVAVGNPKGYALYQQHRG